MFKEAEAEAEKLATETEKELPDEWEKYRGSLMLQKSRRKSFKERVVVKSNTAGRKNIRSVKRKTPLGLAIRKYL